MSLPVDSAWDLLNDVERIAPCMPGAQLTGADGDEYRGTVKLKIGPMAVQYQGTATVEKRDVEQRTLSLRARGRDSRGQGGADATVTARLAPDGEGTRVTVETRLSVTGKVAQFGKGVMEDISKKLMGQFASCLETKLAADREEPAPSAEAAPPAAAEPEPLETLDVMSLAGGALLKRLIPAAVALAVATALTALILRRLRS